MKKWKLLAGLTLLLLLLLSVTAQADSSSYGVVFGAANVNLRSAPTTSSAVLGAYNKGTWMTVRGYSNGFYQVETPDGRYGWMRQDYLLVSADATGTIGYVSHAGYLNLRREASTSAKVLGKYDDGTPCVILDRAGDWYYVSVGGQTGYFLTRFISPAAASTPTSSAWSFRRIRRTFICALGRARITAASLPSPAAPTL